MGNLEKTYKIKHKNKYDTDRYEERYFMASGRFEKTVWAANAYVGPGTYNMGHIDNIIEPRKNDVDNITDAQDPFFRSKMLLYKERAKFMP